MNSGLRNTYKVVRSLLFSVILAVAAIYLIIYVLISLPSIQNSLRAQAESRLSELFGGELSVGKLDFYPFNELVLTDVTLADPDGNKCISVNKIGAGINLWRLISRREVEITYAELIYPEVSLWQNKKDGPINIRFLIDALSPKDKTKPPTQFDLRIHSVLVRGGKFSFSRRWMPESKVKDRIDFNHIRIDDINADVEIPRLKNDDFLIDLRRIAFKVPGLLDVDKIGCVAHITPTSISVKDLVLKLPGTDIRPADFNLNFASFNKIRESIFNESHNIVIVGAEITPYDFRGFLPRLSYFPDPFILDLSAHGTPADLQIERFSLRDSDSGVGIRFSAKLSSIDKPSRMAAEVDDFRLFASSAFVRKTLNAVSEISPSLAGILTRAGDLRVNLSGLADLSRKDFSTEGVVRLSAGDLDFSVDANGDKRNFNLDGFVTASGLRLGYLLNNEKIGVLNLDASGNIRMAGKDLSGSLSLNVPSVEINGKTVSDIALNISKSGDVVTSDAAVNDPSVNFTFRGDAVVNKANPALSFDASARNLLLSDFLSLPRNFDYSLSGDFEADLRGSDIDSVNGFINISDLSLRGGENGDLSISHINLNVDQDDSYHRFKLDSDWLSALIEGDFRPSSVPLIVQDMLARALPSLVKMPVSVPVDDAGASFVVNIYKDSGIIDFFRLPVKWYDNFTISGSYSSNPSTLELSTSLPYLLQGRDKLIRDISLKASLDGNSNFAGIKAGVLYPTKKGDLRLDLDLNAIADNISLAADFNRGRNVSFHGGLLLGALLSRNLSSGDLECDLHLSPSSFFLNKAEWKLSEADIEYSDRSLSVNGFNLRHDDQFVSIEGKASSIPDDILSVDLANIDLQYIFDTLNINYVSFGGEATGLITASNVMTASPQASTDNLFVRNLSYNGAVLGDGKIRSRWDNDRKCVSLDALIKEKDRQVVDMKGGIWVTRDSLSFDFDADKVNVGFLQPFMSAFADEFSGRASGKALLYGTFKDIDLKGDLFADSINIKLGFTNVAYHGSDSVRITPGRIEIPRFRIYDRNGNSANLAGVLTHRYFHEPSFDFKITEVNKLLCYDTNEKINSDWWGTIYGSGTAAVVGRPGFVNVSANMTTTRNSTFTFVLNDREDADEYRFLTFTDKSREEQLKLIEQSEPDYMKLIRKNNLQQQGPPTVFSMDLRVDVTPSAALTLVMDPVGGDRIRARGSGNLNMGYSSDSDELSMFGRYTLDQGTYNFTLQDLILKDFTIRPGSSISFNGDPFDATLNISAAYRVNTNLTDLDKSFATDKDLNRTNVPVDALLNVSGDMTSPNVTFDIDLPTLTEETTRKVRSIISTEDMMSRQIIYLLALNRFYTPEYMGVSSNGGEWASVASSTLSSQLSSMLGQLTDKVNVMPSLRSDKGDFSDIEVDVALSSRLLNNRLLINGNFGYRDHSTSTTTFVGDFDIEYLLNSNGNLRLKAYNHFNDQNYYLRQALTTQGIGIIYRREFDNPFSFLRPRRKAAKDKKPE